MIVTEEQAKEKWCPHAIASHTNPRQRIGDPETWLHHCIGSECMAWRLGAVDYERSDAPIGEGWKEGWRLEGGVHVKTHYRELPRRGFCGLAGRVEP